MESIFEYSMKFELNVFLFIEYGYSFFQESFLEMICLCTFVEISEPSMCRSFFWTIYFVLLIHLFILVPVPHNLHDCSF